MLHRSVLFVDDFCTFCPLSVPVYFPFKHCNLTSRPQIIESQDSLKQEWRRPLKARYYAVKLARLSGHIDRQSTHLRRAVLGGHTVFMPSETSKNLVQNDKELTLRDSQVFIDAVYILVSKKAQLFSHLLNIFKADAMNSFLVIFFKILLQDFQRLSSIRYDLLS